jgi:D-alanine-D-alanine ligase
MKPLRIMSLVREGLVPPPTMEGVPDDKPPEWKMEFDVISTLKEMGHQVHTLGVYDDLAPIRDEIAGWKPHVAFMMLEEFHGIPTYDQAIVSYLELKRQRYTGCNARGLLLTHDKALSKKILMHHHIGTPAFVVFPIKRKIKIPPKLRFPLFVKSTTEDASHGISQASVVNDEQELAERVGFIHKTVQTEAIAEEFIDGREFYVGVLGNHRLQTFPVWEMDFSGMPDDAAHIATSSVKWDGKYQKKYGIMTGPAKDLSTSLRNRIDRMSRQVYQALNMNGYGRIDLRMRDDGELFVLEANANPNLSYGEDFAESAEAGGVPYEELLARILRLGLSYPAPWTRGR